DTALCQGTSSRAFLTSSGLIKSCHLRDVWTAHYALHLSAAQAVSPLKIEFRSSFLIGNGHCTTVLAACAAWLQRQVASRGWIRGAHHASCSSRSTSACLAHELSLG